MNKQEAIDQLKESLSKMIENIEGYRYATQHCFDIIKQIDEQEKPVVPQFVADWYEENKDDFEYGVYKFCVQFYKDESEPSTNLYRWFNDDNNKCIETLVKMKLFGYEVEKDKKYIVVVKGNEFPDYLVDTVTNGFRFYNNIYTDKREHTRKELEEAGFGWVFDCEGVEIIELEE